ncbi:hypothetical protein niasHT_031354 [Heterodera trifolii]|uniref:F-box domain-containing protein n=1 Tax=Heterodera trifolii TaxID=157864 RepID=A0ABD2J2E6_9BILA
MADNGNEAEEEMAQALFISADCWLKVFELLPPSQLGLGIALISHRFDSYVDEHFKTRKWSLKSMAILHTIGENGTKQMCICDLDGKPMPFPQIQMPRKVTGFKRINITYINRNVFVFLRRFRQLFAVCPINLDIYTDRERVLELFLRNIWPTIATNIRGMFLFTKFFHDLRQFEPAILDDCPSLRFVHPIFRNPFPELPADNSAMASDGQALAKWLFTPLQNNMPKVFKCDSHNDDSLATKLDLFKLTFSSASSPVNFIVSIWFDASPLPIPVVPFAMTNKLTGEQLMLKEIDDKSRRFLLVRCPIARDADKWAKWEKEALGWQFCDQCNQLRINITGFGKIGDGLLHGLLGLSEWKLRNGRSV